MIQLDAGMAAFDTDWGGFYPRDSLLVVGAVLAFVLVQEGHWRGRLFVIEGSAHLPEYIVSFI